MALPVNAVKRFSLYATILLVAAVPTAWMAAPAIGQSAGGQAPVAKPLAPSTQAAPATQSPEEALWDQILALRQLPPAPAGTTQPLEDPAFVKTLNEQLDKSLTLINEYLKKYPNGSHVEDVQLQRLDVLRLQAAFNKKPFTQFEAEAQKVLKSNAPINVKAGAEYMLMGIEMDARAKDLLNSQLTQEQREQAMRQAFVQKAKEFIAKYPKTPFAERFYVLLIDTDLEQGDIPEAKAVLEQLRATHPDSQFIPEIVQAIQEEAAAASQAAASQSAASQPGAPSTMAAPGAAATRPTGK